MGNNLADYHKEFRGLPTSLTKEKKKNHFCCSCPVWQKREIFILQVSYSVTGSKYILDLLNQFGVGVCYQTCRNQFGSLSSKLPPNLHKLVGSDCCLV